MCLNVHVYVVYDRYMYVVAMRQYTTCRRRCLYKRMQSRAVAVLCTYRVCTCVCVYIYCMCIYIEREYEYGDE